MLKNKLKYYIYNRQLCGPTPTPTPNLEAVLVIGRKSIGEFTPAYTSEMPLQKFGVGANCNNLHKEKHYRIMLFFR